MTRKRSTHLVPALVLGLGILASTAVAAGAPDTAGWLLASALPMVGAVIVADALRRRAEGARPLPTWSAATASLLLVAACGVIAVDDPADVAPMVPILGAAAATFVVPGFRRRSTCHRPS